MLVILSIFAGLLVVVAGMFLVFFLIESNKHSYTKDALLSQRAKNKSIEVRMGFMVEKMAPFLLLIAATPVAMADLSINLLGILATTALISRFVVDPNVKRRLIIFRLEMMR